MDPTGTPPLSRAPAGEPPLVVDSLTVAAGGRVLLEDVSFRVAPGRVCCILGGSGCGKSTLLRHVIGLEKPLAGEVRFSLPPRADLEAGAPRIGVTFQHGALFGSMSLWENVALPLRSWTRFTAWEIEAIVASKLHLVGLSGHGQKRPAELSGGMRKRGAIARALALDPALLFLDEPSAGLDPVSAAGLDELIVALKEGLGATIVLVTHELASVFRVADHCVMLDREARGVIAEGGPARLRDESQDPRVRRFFRRESEGAIP